LANAILLQLISHQGTASVIYLGLLCRNKMIQPVRIIVVNGTRSVFLMPVVPDTFGPIWPWFRTAGNNLFTDRHRAVARSLPTSSLRNRQPQN